MQNRFFGQVLTVTLKDLKSLHALNKEIEYQKKMLFYLNQKCDHVSVIGVGALKKSQYAEQIQSIKKRLEKNVERCFKLYNEILDFINTVPDPLLRLSLSLRYVNALEWEQIALHIGGGNTADGIRKACERYIRKNLC